MDVSIVIPVYNEEANVIKLIDEIKSVVDVISKDVEVIFIDDGSQDLTADKLAEALSGDDRFKLLLLASNYGQTTAMMAGIDHAVGDIIVPMDGDLQNDPQDIPGLLEKLNEGFDVCSGWRKNRQDRAISRIIPSKAANWLISKVSGVDLHDHGCTLKAYRKNVFSNMRLYGEMHRFIPVHASLHGAKITEIVVNHRPRVSGKSNYGLERVFKVLLDLLVFRFLSKYSHSPIYLFGGFGALNLSFSLAAFIFMLYFKYFGDKSFIETPLPMVAIMFFLVGVLSILLGLIAEILNRTYYESQDKKPYLVKLFK